MFNIAAWTTHLKCSHTDLVVLWDFWYWELGLFLVIQGDSYLLDIRYLQRTMVVYILDSYINLSSSILDPFIYTSIYRRGFRLPQCSHLRTLKNLLKVHFGETLWKIRESLDKIGKPENFEEIHFFPVSALYPWYRYETHHSYKFWDVSSESGALPGDPWYFIFRVPSIIYFINKRHFGCLELKKKRYPAQMYHMVNLSAINISTSFYYKFFFLFRRKKRSFFEKRNIII